MHVHGLFKPTTKCRVNNVQCRCEGSTRDREWWLVYEVEWRCWAREVLASVKEDTMIKSSLGYVSARHEKVTWLTHHWKGVDLIQWRWPVDELVWVSLTPSQAATSTTRKELKYVLHVDGFNKKRKVQNLAAEYLLKYYDQLVRNERLCWKGLTLSFYPIAFCIAS